ncbi:hypothetical protein C8Q77DRAFT_602122 [Trametes polyzona]|nr:hypothetical protein C8Q77DRAFT_602122 [Trametes polyzona]
MHGKVALHRCDLPGFHRFMHNGTRRRCMPYADAAQAFITVLRLAPQLTSLTISPAHLLFGPTLPWKWSPLRFSRAKNVNAQIPGASTYHEHDTPSPPAWHMINEWHSKAKRWQVGHGTWGTASDTFFSYAGGDVASCHCPVHHGGADVVIHRRFASSVSRRPPCVGECDRMVTFPHAPYDSPYLQIRGRINPAEIGQAPSQRLRNPLVCVRRLEVRLYTCVEVHIELAECNPCAAEDDYRPHIIGRDSYLGTRRSARGRCAMGAPVHCPSVRNHGGRGHEGCSVVSNCWTTYDECVLTCS